MEVVINLKVRLNQVVSSNEFYSNKLHWSRRKRIKDDYHILVKAETTKIKKVEPITFPVMLRIDYFFKTRMFDVSNCSIMTKMIEDSLVKSEILQDDTPKWVPEIRSTCQRSDTDFNWVSIRAYNYDIIKSGGVIDY